MSSYMDIANPEQADYEHVESILKEFPARWAFGFARKYNIIKKSEGRRAANLYLIDRKESIKPHQIGLAASDEEIVNAAKVKARFYFERINNAIEFELTKNPSPKQEKTNYKSIYDEIAKELDFIGISAPKAGKNPNYEALCRRFSCDKWWRKALRVSVGRHVEHEAIKAGFVGFSAAYVSNETMERRRQQIKRNNQMLEWIEAENDAGYKSTLAELSKAGVANPVNRHNELMTRIRGIEEEAIRKGLVCEFYTFTCPSKYHPTSGGRSNKKYNGASPKEAQEYLNKQWQKMRAAFGRSGLNPVGFRVAEPHKDACPHWHLMLFVKPCEVKELRSICSRYALEIDGGEKGAKEHRFKAVAIDPNKGSAAGYIAKYIAKNINMTGIDDFDRDGKSAADGLERSVAWAAVWGIRQFQEIGNQVITIWRELRRIREGHELPDVVALLWRAADAGEYGHFIREAVKRDISLIRETEQQKPLYGQKIAPDDAGVFSLITAQISELVTGFVNRYGEDVAAPVKGVLVDTAEVVTRFLSWSFSYKPQRGLLGLV